MNSFLCVDAILYVEPMVLARCFLFLLFGVKLNLELNSLLKSFLLVYGLQNYIGRSLYRRIVF